MTGCPAPLAAHAQRRSARTVALAGRAIEALQASGAPVSIRAMTAAARTFDGAPKLSESAILRNSEAHALYEQARTYPRRRVIRRAKPDRRARHLERLTKAQLIARVHQLQDEVRQLKQCLMANAFAEPTDPTERSGDPD